MNLKQVLDNKISLVLSAITGEADCQALINYSKSEQFGDYQANGIMALAKRLKQNPRELGQQVLAQLDLGGIAEKVELAGPGFINIAISPDFLATEVTRLNQGRLVELSTAPQTIVVDYSSPNLAKEMHVGHLRGTIIGDAIARTLDYLGHTLIRQNHFGDWGTQFGMLITHMLELEQDEDTAARELADLETFYRIAKQRFDTDENFARVARDNVVKLQSGDPVCLALWHRFIEVSIAHCQHLYEKLNVTLTAHDIVPESFYNDKLEQVIQLLDQAGLLRESEGAKCVFLDEFRNQDGKALPTIVQKSGGGYLYATTDLAAIRYRSQVLQADRVLYVVDARQTLHFQQVFAVAKRAGLASAHCSLEHLSYGTMMGADGKPFKTRTGGTVKLIDLLAESVERAFKLVSSKNPDLAETEKRRIAEVVGIAAVKYADLSKNRNSDYVFDWDSMLSFEGNTAPYLLYAYARISSIFRREEIDTRSSLPILIRAAAEKNLALKLLQFTDVVETVARDGFPNQLCLYLYELAGVFMKFYEACPVLKAENAVRESRLRLCLLTSRTLQQGLELLGIETLERM
ncbi:MAG: arginine--tRNA ligase [Pseudomonadales bacterium]|nr:arginine--tRNA ligase [Pseudomonadales bacterium]